LTDDTPIRKIICLKSDLDLFCFK